MSLQANTIIDDFKIIHVADAVKMLLWISTYVVVFPKKIPKHIKILHVSLELFKARLDGVQSNLV